MKYKKAQGTGRVSKEMWTESGYHRLRISGTTIFGEVRRGAWHRESEYLCPAGRRYMAMWLLKTVPKVRNRSGTAEQSAFGAAWVAVRRRFYMLYERR